MECYDILIVGGGLVGASLACAVSRLPLKVAVVEAIPFADFRQKSYDTRAIALSYGSRRIFEGLGIWSSLMDKATPIHSVHTSQRGHFGVTRLVAKDYQVPALGYVVEARALGAILSEDLAQHSSVTLHCPAVLDGIQLGHDYAQVTLTDGRCLQGRLVIAADGGRSRVREQLAISSQRRDYGQTAVIATLTSSLPHRNVAYERFTDTGPMAILPLAAGRCAIVWTLPTSQAPQVLAMTDDAFLAAFQQGFGNRLGILGQVSPRHAYPLVLQRAEEVIRPRLALAGNALHAVHPIAGQGFNLGLRDVAALGEVLWNSVHRQQDPGDPAVLSQYLAWRQTDLDRTVAWTDGLVRLFSNTTPVLNIARSIGLTALDWLPPLKSWLAREAMGITGKQPRLSLGLPLAPLVS